MIEHAYTFGRDNSLVGILSEPDENHLTAEKPTVLLLNANVLHRIGPFRLYVRLARKLSAQGFRVLRFDLSGIGDSPARRSELAYDERTVSEVKEAMDFITKVKGANKFVLLGLCAGADSAYRTAVADKRVVGMVLLDGYGYRTVGYYLRFYLPRLVSVGVWKRFIQRNFKKLNPLKQDGEQDMSEFYTGVRNFPAKNEMEKDLKNFIKNNVKILCVFTGGLQYLYYNYKNQFRDMFKSIKFNDDIRVEYYKDAAHTYVDVGDRQKLIETISNWVSKYFS